MANGDLFQKQSGAWVKLGNLQGPSGSNGSNGVPSPANIQNNSYTYAVDSGVANAYVVTLSPALTSYTSGVGIEFQVTNANTGASTLNVNGLGAVPLTKSGTTTLAAGDLKASQVVTAIYDGTQFQLQGVSPTVAVPAEQLIATGTPSGTNTYTFSSVGSFTDLKITVRGASSATSQGWDDIWVTFNGDTGTNYDTQNTSFTGTTNNSSETANQSYVWCGWIGSTLSTVSPSAGGAIEILVFDYRGTTFHKHVSACGGIRTSSGNNLYTSQTHSWWRNTGAITSVTVRLNLGQFITGTKISLYGRIS